MQKVIASKFSAFFFVILIILISYAFFTPRYNVNDDPQIRAMLSGLFPFYPPTEYVYFIHPYYALVLVNLYKLSASIHWYDIALFLQTFIATLYFIRGIFLNQPSLNYKLGLFLLLFLIIGPLFIEITFSTVSGFTAISGIIFSLCSLQNKEKQNSKEPLIYLFLSLLLSMLLRDVSFKIVMCLAVFSSFPILLNNMERKYALRFISVCTCAIGISFILAHLNNQYFESNSNWQNLPEYNLANNAKLTYLKLNNHDLAEAFKGAGLHANDALMWRYWFYEHKVFRYENILKVYEYAANQFPKPWERTDLVYYTFESVCKITMKYNFCILLLGALFSIVYKNRKYLDYSVFLIVSSIFIGTCISIYAKLLPSRIHYLFLVLNIGLLFAYSYKERWAWFTKRSTASFVLCLLLVLFGLFNFYLRIVTEKDMKTYDILLADDIQNLKNTFPEDIRYVLAGVSAIPFENWMFPFRDLGNNNFNLIAFTGWTSHTDYNFAASTYSGIDDLTKAICNDAKIRFFAEAPPQVVARFMLENYGQSVQIKRVFLGNIVQLFHCY